MDNKSAACGIGSESTKGSKNCERPELVFWFDAPPRSGAGAFQFIAREWGSKVYYICTAPMRKERSALGWEDCEHGLAEVTILSEKPDPVRFVRHFVQKHSGAINICNGFRSSASHLFKKYVFPSSNNRIVMWAERPGVYENNEERYFKKLVPFIYRFYSFRYGSKVKAFLPLGTLGIEAFARLNWDRNILFPFMYDPQIPADLLKAFPRAPGKPLRLLYLGQFSWRKGVHILRSAFDEQLNGEWRLDLVGRNGNFESQMIGWANEHQKISYLGVWPSQEVVKRIAQYDVCLIPSLFDGWGVVTNEAIHAGIGVIISDAAASNDLVRASGAGMVLPAGDVEALRKGIQMVIDTPSLADEWKEKARAYAHRISSESVGRYLMDVLEYTCIDSTRQRPPCPWL